MQKTGLVARCKSSGNCPGAYITFAAHAALRNKIAMPRPVLSALVHHLRQVAVSEVDYRTYNSIRHVIQYHILTCVNTARTIA